jgi:aminomethyltransferase
VTGHWSFEQRGERLQAEHRATRSGAGLFDVSHMGEFEVTGPDRNAFVNRITCNDVGALGTGDVQYSALLTAQGTFVDDCTVYRFEDKVMLVVNAANMDKDWKHVVDQKGGANVRLKNISADVGLLALQGPTAEAVLAPVTDIDLPALGYYTFTTGKVAGADCFVSRTGYTGEDGFEIYCRWRDTEAIWKALEGPGKAQPIGLGARDSLRLEVAYPLYGNDIDDTTTPLEAGLSWIVKLDKGAPFTGMDALRAHNYAPEEISSIEVVMHHSPGMLSSICQKIGSGGINIHYLYASAAVSDETCLAVLSTDNNERALVLLND